MKLNVFIIILVLIFAGCSKKIDREKAIQTANEHISGIVSDSRLLKYDASWKQGAWQIRINPLPSWKPKSERKNKLFFPLFIEIDRKGNVTGFI